MLFIAPRKSSSGCLSTVMLTIILSLLFVPVRSWGLESINISYGSIGTSQSLFSVTEQAGIFKKHGLDATLIFIAGHGIKPLIAGDVQFAVSGGPPAVSAILAGANIKILLASPGEKFTIMGEKGIKSPRDLRGGRFGISQFGTTSDVVARLALKAMGLRPEKDVTLVQIGSQSARIAGLKSGAIQAASLALGWGQRLRGEGLTTLLPEFQPPFPGSVVSVSVDYLKRRPKAVLEFTRSVVEGIYFYTHRPEKAKRYLGKFLKLSPGDPALDKLYQESTTIWNPLPALDRGSLHNLLKILSQRNPKASQLRFKEVAATGSLEQVKREGFLKQLASEYESKKR